MSRDTNNGALHLFAARSGLVRNARRPFTVEVTCALAARPDASFVLLLATWLTHLAYDFGRP